MRAVPVGPAGPSAALSAVLSAASFHGQQGAEIAWL